MAYHLAQFAHVRYLAGSHCLDKDVAHCRGFHGPCPYGYTQGIGCELVEQTVLRTASNDVQALGLLWKDIVNTRYGLAVFGG